MSFKDLPKDFPAITKATLALLSEPIGPPPDMRSIGQKTFEAFAEQNDDFESIRTRDWRQVPYAIWLNQTGGLQTIPHALERYFKKELPSALVDARRPLKWGRPLIFIYIEQYNPSQALFKRLAISAKHFFNAPQLENASSIVKLARSLNLFDTSEGPKRTAESIAASRKTLSDWLQINELWPSFGTSPFAEAAFNAFLQTTEDFRRTTDFVHIVFEWGIINQDELRYAGSRAKLAEALLLPWRLTQPSDAIKNRLMPFLLKRYGDPRLGKNLWHDVSSEAIQVLINWINGRTLDAFFRILRNTADKIWEHRQKFWEAYFKAGHIEEAWIALGPDAALVLSGLDNAKQLKYAKLFSAASSQSVLLLRIGPIIFCEWSHDGRLRAQRLDAPQAPSLYKSYYDADTLRFVSLDFNNGQTQDPGLVHFSSSTGGWQERGRLFIQKQIGIRMAQAEVT